MSHVLVMIVTLIGPPQRVDIGVFDTAAECEQARYLVNEFERIEVSCVTRYRTEPLR